MLIDTSAIIEILKHPAASDKFKLIEANIGSEHLYVLVIQLAELSDWCISNRFSVRETIEAVKKFASIISLDEEICLEGSRVKAERRKKGYPNFGLIDGLTLAAARTIGERLLTFDQDFSGERDCTVLK